MENVYSGKMSLDAWGKFLIEFIVSNDLSEELVGSFLRHLADLGVLLPCDDDVWEWCNSEVELKNLIARIKNDLESLSDSESGFALAYFIGYKKLNKKPLDDKVDSKDNINRKQSKLPPDIKPASDLSNLQIVKKTGKQLQPFLQIEESVVSRLTGKHVGKQDAQKLFHYMFGKVCAKAEPRVWEQLSRKRHR
ncbi:MAG TPA: hypothetical protein EYQ03_03445 [Nitrospinaceae bacterium]|jgi:hypothetical protein|nr:hypothetical protein [Nitrospinaceae bacterium]|tara:strand:- start:2195 stop:2773 length:579 start_codon:yes stop_codon:yes gene_type:complete